MNNAGNLEYVVRHAYNAGFFEGVKESGPAGSKGGKGWHEVSAYYAALLKPLTQIERRAEDAEAERDRVVGLIGHLRDHLLTDEDFDAAEWIRDVEGSTDLTEYDRLARDRVNALERANKAEAERDRLREALEKIAGYDGTAGLTARAALEATNG